MIRDIEIINSLNSLKNVHKVWEALFLSEQIRITHLLIKQVIIKPEGIEVAIYSDGLNILTDEIKIANETSKSVKKEAA